MISAVTLSLVLRIFSEELELLDVILKTSLLAIYLIFWMVKMLRSKRRGQMTEDEQSYLKQCNAKTLMKLANKKTNELIQIFSQENQTYRNNVQTNLKP